MYLTCQLARSGNVHSSPPLGNMPSEVLAYALQSSIEVKKSTLKLKSSTTSQNHSWEN